MNKSHVCVFVSSLVFFVCKIYEEPPHSEEDSFHVFFSFVFDWKCAQFEHGYHKFSKLIAHFLFIISFASWKPAGNCIV